MKTATKLLTTAFAVAALVSTSLSLAQTAQAASGPDLQASTGADYKIARNGGDGGGAWIFAEVTNVGNAKSTATVMIKSCAYAPASGSSRQVEWAVVDPLHQLVPALDPQQSAPDTKFYCPVFNGRMPLAARISVAASQGDTNMANNKATTWIFKLD